MDEGDLAALLRRHAARHSVPGAALGVLRDGTATTATWGVADVRTGDPVTPDTLFSVGSLTKSMVATVIAWLVDAGQLSLDDPVAAHVPELSGDGWAQGATLRDLLANRSGLALRADLEFGFAGSGDTDDLALARLVADVARSAGTAGTAGSGPATGVWSYTNIGWCLLGRVIETVTQTCWEDAMRSHLASAGVRETRFVTDGGTEGRASGHQVTARAVTPVEPLVARAYGPAGTTAVSTMRDLLRFARVHLEQPRLGDLRDTPQDVSIHGWLDAWYLGWAGFDWQDGPLWGWDAVVPGERSVLRIDPARRSAVVLLTNGSTGPAMYRSLFAELMASEFGVGVPSLHLHPSAGAGPAAQDLSRFAGTYAWPDRRVEVQVAEDRLLIMRDDREIEALPVGAGTFLVDAADPDTPTVTFGAVDPTGRPGALYLMVWGLPRTRE